jgi:hypothetical protein
MPAGVIDQLRALRDWAPAIGYARRYSAAANEAERSNVIADALEWAASRTVGRLDDRLASRVADILRTPQGVALVREVLSIVDSLPQEPAA